MTYHSVLNTADRSVYDGSALDDDTSVASTTDLRPIKQSCHAVEGDDGRSAKREESVETPATSSIRPTGCHVWLWEIVSCIASLTCTSVLAGILLRFDNHPLPSWPLGITLNAMISVLAVSAKACTVLVLASCIGQLKWHWFASARSLRDFETFDQASRGPIGSIALLIRLRPLHLAAIGAVLTILAIAVEPFAQQIVSYEQRPAWVPNDSYAYRAQGYDSSIYFDENVLEVGPEFGMKAAIYSGLFTKPDITGPKPKCDTGNCTIPPFTSLAVCSKCANVTDQTTRLSIKKTWQHNDTFVSCTDGDCTRENDIGATYNITYALPGNVVMNLTYTYSQISESPLYLSSGAAMTSRTDHSNDMTRILFNVSSPITALSVLQFREVNAVNLTSNYTATRPLAWECALYFCVNTYAVDVTSGISSTRLLSSWHDADAAPIDYTDYLPTSRELNPPMILRVPASLLPTFNSTTSQNSTFSVSAPTRLALSAYLNHTLDGVIEQRNSFDADTAFNTWVDDTLSVLNLTTDLGDLFDGLSISMTNYLRSGVPLDPESSYAVGSAYTMQPFVVVHWHWISLPVAIVLLTAGFLAATAAVSATERVWKESSLAMMFRGIEDTGERLTEMRGAAERRKAVLGWDAHGRWRLVPADAIS